MGKIVKFCSECEEGFAEKFGFCPNCGAPLEAFEMNPLHAEAEKPEAEFIQPEKPAFISSSEPVRETVAVEEPVTADDEILELNVEGEETEEEITDEPEAVTEEFIPAATTAYSSNGNSEYKTYQQFSNADVVEEDDDDYHITVLEEKNVKQRNGLLLGSLVLMLTMVFGGFIYSLFAKDFDLAAIGGDDYIDFINDVGPVEIEEEAPKPADDDKDAGGGGGGGREEKTETSKGRYANQSREEPIIRPDANIIQRSNPELKLPPVTTVGDKKFPPSEERYGNPNSRNPFGQSNGTGSGGGQGEGSGAGQGNGRGDGAGNGNGTGFGNGDGDGNGNGRGSDDRTRRVSEPREPEPVGPSRPLNITFKPKPKYTDEARQNNITGNVRVRVTFLPSGQIGSVAPVSNLGYGLTEQAIAAARAIRFEPQMQNGRPVAVTKVVVFTFTIY